MLKYQIFRKKSGLKTRTKFLVLSMLFAPVFSYGGLDFDGFLRLRASTSTKSFGDGKSQETTEPFLRLDPSFYIQGFVKPKQNFEMYFSILSSPLVSFQGFSKSKFHPIGLIQTKAEQTKSTQAESVQTEKEINTEIQNFFNNQYLRPYFYAKWFLTKEFSIRFGRVPFESIFHQILSSNFYERYLYVFDGLFLNYSTDFISVDLWSSLVPKRWVGDKEIEELNKGAGLTIDVYSVSDFLSHFNFHLVYLFNSLENLLVQDQNLQTPNLQNQNLPSQTIQNRNLESGAFSQPNNTGLARLSHQKKITRFGLGIEGHLTNFNLNYKLIGIAHGQGFKFKTEESMLHAEVSYNLAKWYSSHFKIAYHVDTKNYNPWLYDRHNNGGLLDLFIWGNLTYVLLAYESSFNKWFDLKISFYQIESTDGENNHVNFYGDYLNKQQSIFNSSGSQSSYGNYLGKEIDIEAFRKINKKFTFNALLGIFLPNKSIKALIGKDFYARFQIQTQYQF